MNRLTSIIRPLVLLSLVFAMTSGLLAGTYSKSGTYTTVTWPWYNPGLYYNYTVSYSASISDDIRNGPAATENNAGWTFYPITGAAAGGSFGTSLYYPGIGGDWATFTGTVTLGYNYLESPWTPAINATVMSIYYVNGIAQHDTDLEQYHQMNQDRLQTKGDPVQLATGVEASHRTLFKFSGARDWEFTLSYNSVNALNAFNPFGLGLPLPLGRGWSHNFQASFFSGGSPVHYDSLHTDIYSRSDFFPSASDPNVYVSATDATQHDTLVLVPGISALLTHADQSSQLFDLANGGRLLEDRDPQGRKLVMGYNTSGQLSAITEPISGTSLSLGYDSSGRLHTLTDSSGAAVGLDYVAVAGGMESIGQITNQNGEHTVFTYDANAQITTMADHTGQVLLTNTILAGSIVAAQADGVPGHTTTTYGIQGAAGGGRTTTYTDHNGKQSVYTFDAQFNTLTEKDPLNHTITCTYDVFNQVTSVTDPLNRTTTYTYDVQGNLLTRTDPAGKVTTYTYDSHNNLLTTTDAASQVTTRTYDSNNNLLTLVDALGRTTTWTYDSNSLPLTMTLPGGGVYHYTYTDGRLTTATDPTGVATNFSYNANGRLLYREDALGKRVTFTYDAVGNVLTVTNALNQVTTYEYDHRNRVKKLTDPTGVITQYTYDNNSNLLTSTDALGKVASYTYDGENRLKTVVDALNRTTTYNYDDVGRLTSVADPAGNTTAYEYDAAGQLTAVVDALGKRTTTAYDTRGLLTSVTDPLSRVVQFTYNDVGRRLTAKDPLNRITQFEYDALNRVKKVIDPGSLVAEQGFDVDGNRTSLKNPANHSTTFAYDTTGRLTTTTTPEVHVTNYTYNSRGLPDTVVQPSGHTTSFSYDDVQRLSGTTDPVGTISLTRDADGRVLTVVEGGKTLTRAYDALGRLTSYTDGDGNVIGYAYDDISRLTQLTYPDGKHVNYAYDSAGRLGTVTDWANRVTTYSYDAVGHVTQLLRPNGTRQVRTYDDAGQLTQLTELAPDGVTVIYSGAHSYDTAGQLTGEAVVPGVTPASVNVVQTFDGNNRLLTHNGAAATFDPDGNLLSLASGVSPSAYTYDARNRLTAAGGLTYGYNAENRRVSVTDGTGTTTYAVNPNAVLDQVLVRTAPDGTKTFYAYGLGLLHEETGSAIRYYHTDRRGDTIALTDGSGNVTDRANYGVYGELLSRTGTTNTPFLFNGKWGVQTDFNGIYYHRARYYHPGLRRFLNQDLLVGDILRHATLNRFAFCNGDPLNGVDPNGRLWGEIASTIGQTFASGGQTIQAGFAQAAGILIGDRQAGSAVASGYFNQAMNNSVAGQTLNAGGSLAQATAATAILGVTLATEGALVGGTALFTTGGEGSLFYSGADALAAAESASAAGEGLLANQTLGGVATEAAFGASNKGVWTVGSWFFANAADSGVIFIGEGGGIAGTILGDTELGVLASRGLLEGVAPSLVGPLAAVLGLEGTVAATLWQPPGTQARKCF